MTATKLSQASDNDKPPYITLINELVDKKIILIIRNMARPQMSHIETFVYMLQTEYDFKPST